ncbi:MAG: rhodanese-like domain-containing protein [Bdellovibrionales bacterium]|nr:rhodanese-like domain-containing protein [Bdellovibrionales bacterium]
MKSKIISTEELKKRTKDTVPDNLSRSAGFALINVLPANYFAMEHIPNSINVPVDDLDTLKGRFDTEKEIIVYCASAECDASEKAVRKLKGLGFTNVKDFEGGTQAWKEAGHRVSGAEGPSARPSSRHEERRHTSV